MIFKFWLEIIVVCISDAFFRADWDNRNLGETFGWTGPVQRSWDPEKCHAHRQQLLCGRGK